MIRKETDACAVGIVRLAGISVPEDCAPMPAPETDGDVSHARRLYRAIRQDPTRNRPSSEALYRRLKRGQPLPRINALVDAVNHCSVSLMLPFGCYDLDRTAGEIMLRLGREGEGYEGVGNRWVNVAGRYAVCDDEGPLGNPTMDSLRTAVTPETRRALVLIFAPTDHPLDRVAWVAETLTGVVGGTAETAVMR